MKTHKTATCLFFILLFCVLLSGPVAAQYNSERELFDLRGPVKTVRYENLTGGRGSAVHFEHSCDLIEAAVFNAGGEIISVNTSRIPRCVTTFNPGISLARKYNDQGKLIEESYSAQERFVLSRVIYSYNTSGRRAETAHYNAVGFLYKKDTYSYDSEGRLIECLTIFTDKRPVIKKAYSGHDHYGNWLEEVWLSQYEEGTRSIFVPFMTVHRKITYY